MRKYWIFIFYGIFAFLLITPLLFFPLSRFIAHIVNLFVFRIGLIPFLLVCVCFTGSFLFDFFYINNEDQCLENFNRLHSVLGRSTFGKIFLLSLLSGFSEELFFRGYLFFITVRIFGLPAPVGAVGVSLLFGFFHTNQGKGAFIISALISGVLCYYAFTVNSLVIPILFHVGFNFIQLYFIMPLQEKRIARLQEKQGRDVL